MLKIASRAAGADAHAADLIELMDARVASKFFKTIAVAVLSLCVSRVRAAGLNDIPDAKLQAQLQQIMGVQERDDPLERYRRALALRSMVGDKHDDYERLIANMCYFAKGGDTGVRSGGRVVTFHYLVRMLKLNEPLILSSSLTYLAKHPDDQNLLWFVKTEVLRADAPEPSASPGVDELASVVRSYKEPIEAFVMDVMYTRDSHRALERLIGIYQPDIPTARTLLWTARTVADAHWQFMHEMLRPEDYDAALAGLERILASDRWWQRLYVAEVLWQYGEFRQPELLARVLKDPHPIVVEVAKRMPYEAKLPKRSPRAGAQTNTTLPASNATRPKAFPPPPPANERAREQTQQMIGATALLFGLGLRAGDRAVVSALLWCDNDPNRQIAPAAAEQLRAKYALYQSVCARTRGDPEVIQRELEKSGVAPPDTLTMLMAQGNYKVDGDRAAVDEPDDGPPLPRLRNVNGIWKIDVTPAVIAGGPDEIAKSITHQAAVIRGIADEVQSGRLQTLDDVKAAVISSGLASNSATTNQ